MERLGIVPAGGEATRFGGVLKELLPIYDGVPALLACVRRLSMCDVTTVLTTPDKISTHVFVLDNFPGVAYMLSGDSLWESIRKTLSLGAQRNYFTMPDTIVPDNAFDDMPSVPLTFGVFDTLTPFRYGVFHEGTIHDKDNHTGKAWGTISWSYEVADYWARRVYPTFNDALNDAIDQFGYSTKELDFYYDLASMDDYREWLTRHSM